MSLYLEAYTPGQVFESRGRTVTECDVVNFACHTGDMHPNHTNAAAMANSQFGQRIAHGLLGVAWCHWFLDQLDLITDSAIAFLEIEHWRFLKPIFFGDTVHARITVEGVTPSKSKPDRGVVKFFFELVNQNDEVCQSGYKSIMIKRTCVEKRG